jgi:hypothetical protein
MGQRLQLKMKDQIRLTIKITVILVIIIVSGLIYDFFIYRPVDTGPGPKFLCSADLNNDGLSDVIVCGDNGVYKSSLFIHLNSDWGLNNYKEYKLNGKCSSIGIIDFNNDTYLDIVVAEQFYRNLKFYQNNKKGSFTKVSEIKTISDPSNIEVSDINLDGLNDIVISSDMNNNIAIFINNLNNDTLNFTETQLLKVCTCSILKCCDMNADQYPEIILVDSTNDVIKIIPNDKGEFLDEEKIFSDSKLIGSLAYADFNNDGLNDIVTNEPIILMNNGGFNFSKITMGDFDDLGQIITEDINKDKKIDIITSNGLIFYNKGDWHFEPKKEIWTIENSIAVGNFDDGEEIDVIGIYSEDIDKILLVYGKGYGRFTFNSEYIYIFLIISLIIIIYYSYLIINLKHDIEFIVKNRKKIQPMKKWRFKKLFYFKDTIYIIFILITISIILLSTLYLLLPFHTLLGKPTSRFPILIPLLLFIIILFPFIYSSQLKDLTSHKRKVHKKFQKTQKIFEEILYNNLIGYKKIYQEKKMKKLNKTLDELRKEKIIKRYQNRELYELGKYHVQISLSYHKKLKITKSSNEIDNNQFRLEIYQLKQMEKQMMQIQRIEQKHGKLSPEVIDELKGDISTKHNHTLITISNITPENYSLIRDLEMEINERILVKN